MKTLIPLLLCIIIGNVSIAQVKTNKAIKTYFLGQKIKAQLICTAKLPSAEEADAQTIIQINELLMNAEKTPKMLKVNLIHSNAPIQGDFFVFGLESDKDLQLTIEMFDEDFFLTVVDCPFELQSGGNFLAVNIKELSSGFYNFRLNDSEGREKNGRVQILKE